MIRIPAIYFLLCSLVAFSGAAAEGSRKSANPDNYRRLLSTLIPGDTLVLDAGV